MKKALIVWGGWDGHEPRQVGERFAGVLEEEGFSVTVSDRLESFTEVDLKTLDLIVPIWTMGTAGPFWSWRTICAGSCWAKMPQWNRWPEPSDGDGWD